jgi:2-polyprenyl-3-methyl-5-hydroxy-6-metoxy-1,4-benzoquinol methylase
VGCSNGRLGEELKKTRDRAEVWGIEIDADFAQQAEGRLDRILVGPAGPLLATVDRAFDCVICADVIEHMPEDPVDTMQAVRRVVSPGGHCIVSLPNVRFFTTFVELGIRGRWPRRDRGVHDRTHRHWFTDADARQVFAEAGFHVEDTLTHYRLHDEPGPRNARASRFAHGPLRGFLAYQLLYRLAPDGGLGARG